MALPPVLIRLLGDMADIQSKLTAIEGELRDFADTPTTKKVDADIKPAEEKLAQLDAEVKAQEPSIEVNADIGPALAKVAELKAAVSASQAASILGIPQGSVYRGISKGLIPASQLGGFNDWGRTWRWRIPADALVAMKNSGQSPAALQSLLANAAAAGPEGSGTQAGLEALLAAGAAGRGAGGGGGGGGGKSILGKGGWGGLLLGMLLGHGGKATGGGFLGAFPAFGSLAALSGLGVEHLLMTGVGLAGSAGGALLGGGLLGLGAAGVAGVGMGTDMAGIGQAAGDIKNVVQAQNQLNQAIAVYGPASQQAAQAQNQLNYTLSGFSPVARQAVLAAANTAQGFKQMFDQVTGPAEKTGAEIINQLMQVGEKFLPTIGKFAAENMKIIQSNMQPFLGWLQGPGLSIFKQLEQMFTNQLPTGVQVLSKAFEWLMETILTVNKDEQAWLKKNHKLPLLDQINNFLSKPANFSKWQTEIGKLINLFHVWAGFVSILAKDIYQVFHADAGTGQSIIKTLTQMLTKLHTWLTSTQGQKSMHNVFETHKKEILELLKLIPPLAKVLGGIELKATPVLTTIFTDGLKAIMPFLNLMASNKVTATALGILLISSRMSLLARSMAAVSAASKGLGGVRTLLSGNALGGGMTGALGKAAGYGALGGAAGYGLGTGIAALTGAKGQNKSALQQGLGLVGAGAGIGMSVGGPWGALIGAAVGAVAFGVKELITHWSGAMKALKSAWNATWGAIKSAADASWNAIKGAAETSWNAIKGFFGTIWGGIKSAFNSSVSAIRSGLSAAWNGIKSITEAVWNAIRGFFGSVWSAIRNVVMGQVNAVKRVVTTAWNDVKHFSSGAWNEIKNLVVNAVHALGRGVASNVRGIENWFKGIYHTITNVFKDAGLWLFNVGKAIVQGLINGIENLAYKVGEKLISLVNKVKSIPVIGGLIGSPSPYFTEVGQAMMQGLANGLAARKSLPLGVLQQVVGQATGLVAAPGPWGATPAMAGGGTTIHQTNHIYGATGGPHETASEIAWLTRSMGVH